MRFGATSILQGLLLLSAGLLSSCSFVHFELSPFAPRGFDVVYSEQEDITFLVWRLGEHARLKNVEFELYDDGEFRPIELSDAPFPHEPFECDRIYQCVQYQIPGRWQPPENQTVLRAVHRRHGTFHAPLARFQDVPTTFSIDPIPVNNNAGLRPDLDDWFEGEDIPLMRSFEWSLVEASEQCPYAQTDSWSELARRVDLPRGWTNSPPCFVVRPVRQDLPGAQVARRLIPSAVLFTERVQRRMPVVTHHTFVAFLGDLQVTNAGRCQRIYNTIEHTIYDELDEREIDYTSLGVFRPHTQEGEEETGCDQHPHSQYPLGALFTRALEERDLRQDETPITLLLVYLNNIELPPSERKFEEAVHFFAQVHSEESFHLKTWAISSNTIGAIYPWDVRTPWAPLEDENFEPALRSAVGFQLPLLSTAMDRHTAFSIYVPSRADSPEYFKICNFQPPLQRIFNEGYGNVWSNFHMPMRWPLDDEPRLFFDMEPQLFVPRSQYEHTFVSGVYEVCDRFCDHGFVGPNDQRHPNWLTTYGVCQWN